MTATAAPPATWTAASDRLLRLQLEKAELADDLVERPGSTLTEDARCRIAGRLLAIDDELVEVWAELAAERGRAVTRTRAEREAARSDHQHLCSEIVEQWRERARLAEAGFVVGAAWELGPGHGLSPHGTVWTVVRALWDAHSRARRWAAERRAAGDGGA